MLRRLARIDGLVAIEQMEQVGADSSALRQSASHRLLMARSRLDLGSLVEDPRWVVPSISASTPLWTDDASSIWGVLRWR